jgi:hypothetical protein
LPNESPVLIQPNFEQKIVEDKREDGYWLEAFDVDNDAMPDLMGYGLGLGEVNWYRNPDWEKQLIAKLNAPVGAHYGDIDRDGLTDVIVCCDYGKNMVECDPDGGRIYWFQNPGQTGVEWRQHYIGKATAMHRLRVGYFTQNEKLEVLGLPVVGRPHDVHSPISVKLFTQPEDIHHAEQWNTTIVDDSFFHVIHGVTVKKFTVVSGSNLDSVLIASEEGIIWLYFDPHEGKWRKEFIGTGETEPVGERGFKGSGDVDAGKISDDSFAYIAALEPFHGSNVVVYCKNGSDSLADIRWKRYVLDIFGQPNDIGEGAGHHVLCADFDRDGDDEFLVALRGPMPWQGVFYYKAIDVKNGVFVKWKLSDISASRLAIADFDGDGRLDFATMGYSVKDYLVIQDPKIVVYYNKFEKVYH